MSRGLGSLGDQMVSLAVSALVFVVVLNIVVELLRPLLPWLIGAGVLFMAALGFRALYQRRW